MEDKKMNGAGCVCCDHHHGIGFMILRCLLAIIILAVVFAIGVKIGEVKGAYEYGGYPSMMRGGWGGGVYQMMGGYTAPQGYYQSAPMMRVTTSTAK